ncbi:MAG: hypothetical protein B7X59_10665 [Polaromonas sp. 39-63-203]|nr:MAG: hypothetical protein B7X59_10665 [Polaromonas sp. 39-63-203]
MANAHVWRAGELGGDSLQTVATGYTSLDHVLPGHGWPQGAMTEVLQPQAGLHEWGLVAPALAAVQGASSGTITGQMLVLVGPPHLPFGPALGAAHAHNKLLFVFRPLRAQQESSPAPLRLLLEGTVSDAGNLLVNVFKRRGPPLAAPVLLDTRPGRLSALLAASGERARRRREELAPLARPSRVLQPETPTSPSGHVHALLDRIAQPAHP